MAFNWIETLRTVAPTLASLAGGPLAGTAVSALSNLLFGKPDAPADEIAQAMATASPETLAKLKQLDNDFKAQMKQLDIDLERIAAEDRSSARQREVQVRDKIPGVIAMLVLGGFFGLLALMAFKPLPQIAEAPFNVMLGALGAMVTAIAQYYFGSSASSRAKDTTIATLSNGGR